MPSRAHAHDHPFHLFPSYQKNWLTKMEKSGGKIDVKLPLFLSKKICVFCVSKRLVKNTTKYRKNTLFMNIA